MDITMILHKLIYYVLSVFIILNFGLLLQGVIRKMAARVMRRHGIRLFQPYIDLIKNYTKRSSVSHGIMFYLGPVFRFAGGLGIIAFMPIIFGNSNFANFSYSGDMLLVFSFMFFGMLGMALGASQSGHPYAFVGITRGLAQTTALEIPMMLALISIVIQYKSMSISAIVGAQQGGLLSWTLFTNPLAVLAAMLAYLASMMRNPFSVVLAPQEIPIGPPTEFHSQYLGILQTNRALFGVAKTILFVNLFFGGATSWPVLLLKTFCVYLTSAIVGVVFPRFRVDQSISWYLQFPLIIGILAVLLAK